MKIWVLILLLAAPAAATTYTVDNTGDGGTSGGSCLGDVCDDGGGHCTLRAAFECVNGNPSNATINFGISGCGGVCTITLGSSLPTIQVTVPSIVLDGTTQSGTDCGDLFGGTPPTWNIVVDANHVTDAGLRFAPQATVKGIEIKNVAGSDQNGYGIGVFGEASLVQCCYSHDNWGGIFMGAKLSRAGGNNAGDGNVANNNTLGGISLSNNGVWVAGNFTGTLPDGKTAAANGYGLYFENGAAGGAGGVDNQSRNVIAGNTTDGAFIKQGFIHAVIQNNDLGVDRQTTPLGCNGVEDHGTGTQVVDNIMCATSTPTPTVSTPTPFPTPLCCAYTGGSGISCVDSGLWSGFAGQQITSDICRTVIPTIIGATFASASNGEGCNPIGDLNGACVTVTPAAPTPTMTPTAGGGTPQPTLKAFGMVLNDPVTFNQSWAQELVRRLRNYRFFGP